MRSIQITARADNFIGAQLTGIPSDDAARLIAAAPDMLKALQRLAHPMADDDDLAHALDVIHRATGGDA